jgi:hypothetical protein
MRETEHEVAAWFARYVETYIGLAKGEREDTDALAQFFAVPCTIVTNEKCRAMSDAVDVAASVKREIGRMREKRYATSALLRQDLTVLNQRAALVDAIFSREDREGQELLRFEGSYLVVKTEAGWRFGALIIGPQ